jgi:hypothetical protein
MTRGVILVLALVLVSGLSGCARTPRVTPPIAPTVLAGAVRIPLAPYQGRLRAVRVRAADREWELLFDTGGGLTLVSPALAEAVGCTPRGRVTGHRMSGESISVPTCASGALAIGGWIAPPQTLGIFDVMTLLPSDWPRLDGVVALRSFAGRRLTIDPAALGETAGVGATRLLSRVATGAGGGELLVFAGVTVGTDTLWLEVDSGNLGAVHLAPHAARLLGVSDSVGAEHPEIMLSLVPGHPSAVRGRVRELILDGALNAEWLERGRLTIDLAHGTLWWRPHDP